MAFIAVLLLLPPVVTGIYWYIESTRRALVLFLVSLVPPVLVLVLVMTALGGTHIAGGLWALPFIIAVIEVIALWVAWYAEDPKGAGQALAITEGAAAAYNLKKGHPGVAAVTGAGAVAQWQYSSRRPTQAPPASTPLDQRLADVDRLHAEGVLSDAEYQNARSRLEAAPATSPASAGAAPASPSPAPSPARHRAPATPPPPAEPPSAGP